MLRLAALSTPCRCPIRLALEREYRENYYSEEKPNFIAHAGEDQAWFELAQNDRLAIFEKLLPSDRRRLLDIGCGPGFFLTTAIAARLAMRMASNRRSQAAAHARALGASDDGRLVQQGKRRSAWAAIDAVNLTNVLEHVPDPSAILETRRRHGRQPGGVVVWACPMISRPCQIAARTRR